MPLESAMPYPLIPDNEVDRSLPEYVKWRQRGRFVLPLPASLFEVLLLYSTASFIERGLPMAENKVRKVVFVSKDDQDELERLAELNDESVSAMTNKAIKHGLALMLHSNASMLRTH
jgi:hypothetical protein